MVPSNSSVPGRTNRWKKEVSSNAPWMAGSRLLWEDGGLFWAYLSKLTRNILRWRRKRRKQYPDDPWCGNPNDINYPLKCVFLTCFWYHLNCRMVLFLFWMAMSICLRGTFQSCYSNRKIMIMPWTCRTACMKTPLGCGRAKATATVSSDFPIGAWWLVFTMLAGLTYHMKYNEWLKCMWYYLMYGSMCARCVQDVCKIDCYRMLVQLGPILLQ